MWHYLFHHAVWGHHTALSTDIFIHEIELLNEMSSKCFVSRFSGLKFRTVVFQLCTARPLATHLTFLKKRLSSVIGQPTAELEWEGNVAAKANNQMDCGIIVIFFYKESDVSIYIFGLDMWLLRWLFFFFFGLALLSGLTPKGIHLREGISLLGLINWVTFFVLVFFFPCWSD